MPPRPARIVATLLFLTSCATASVADSRAGAAAAPPTPTIAGCPLFAADNAWRPDVSKLPVSTMSAIWIRHIGGKTNLHPDFGSNATYGIPYVVVPADQTKVPITFTESAPESDPGPYPVPLTAPVEAGSDKHVLVAS